jgi:hypothetical protein
MAQGICGRTAAALTMTFLGLPTFAMDRVANDRVANDSEAGGATLGVISDTGSGPDGAAATRSCPTRFDYVVLASVADAASILSLSSYHFRREVRVGTLPPTGFLRIDYEVESAAVNCHSRALDPQRS